MEQRVSVITLGVDDLERTRSFYEALGWRSDTPAELEVVFLPSRRNDPGTVGSREGRAGQRRRARERIRGVTLAYDVGSPAEVDATIAQARDAGATISREPGETFWGGYSGVLLDPDGHPWEIAHNPGWTLADDGSVTLSV